MLEYKVVIVMGDLEQVLNSYAEAGWTLDQIDFRGATKEVVFVQQKQMTVDMLDEKRKSQQPEPLRYGEEYA